MRHLSYIGFLKRELKEHSALHSTSIIRLTQELEAGNDSLKELLYLFAVESEQTEELFNEITSDALRTEYQALQSKKTLPAEYRKIRKQYELVAGQLDQNRETIDKYRLKIIEMIETSNLNVYRICMMAGFNYGNVFTWIRNNNNSKVSLKKAEEVFYFTQSLRASS